MTAAAVASIESCARPELPRSSTVAHATASRQAPTGGSEQTHLHNCDFTKTRAVRVSSDWLWRGGILNRVKPQYPPEAKQLAVQGEVSVKVLIDDEGIVRQVCATGPALLRSAAEDAALQWKFRPPKLNGTRSLWLIETLTFNFILADANQAESRCQLSHYPSTAITHFIQTDPVRAAKPVYPAQAVRDGLESDVNVAVLVDAKGEVFKSCALSGPEVLGHAAAKAALQLKFKPRPGRRRYAYQVVSYRFTLDKKPYPKALPYILVQPE